MEGKRTKLRIYLEFNFFKKFMTNIPEANVHSSDRTRHDIYRDIFGLILESDLRSPKNGEQYPYSEYVNALAKIGEYVNPPEIENTDKFKFINELKFDFPFNLFFIEFNDHIGST